MVGIWLSLKKYPLKRENHFKRGKSHMALQGDKSISIRQKAFSYQLSYFTRSTRTWNKSFSEPSHWMLHAFVNRHELRSLVFIVFDNISSYTNSTILFLFKISAFTADAAILSGVSNFNSDKSVSMNKPYDNLKTNLQWPLLLTWFNFNPSMDK